MTIVSFIALNKGHQKGCGTPESIWGYHIRGHWKAWGILGAPEGMATAQVNCCISFSFVYLPGTSHLGASICFYSSS